MREPGTRKRPERSWSRRKTSFRRKAEEGYLRRSENPPASAVGSVNYLCISAYSYPMLAIYNAGAALYRSFGKASTTMYISIVSNIVNVVGNCIGVFLLHAGVEGVAWPSLISRTLSAVLITVFCFCE